MSDFSIHTLGCGSAKPTLRHNPSSTVIDYRGNLFMIDCGEGTQVAFMRQRLNFSRLRHIFITHAHGDHVLGLPGLISTLGLGGQGGRLTIHTLEPGYRFLTTVLSCFDDDLTFKIDYDVIRPEEAVIMETPSLTVRTIPLQHRVPTVGFVFEEKPKPRHLLGDMLDFHNVPVAVRPDLKWGADFVKPDGTVIPNARLTTDPSPSLSYAHISDTRYIPSIAEKIGPVDLLFHETTYLEESKSLAKKYFHSTAIQAATVTRDAGAKALLTGHYSARYPDCEEKFKEEAETVFPNVILNREGLVTKL